jgi:hypothetical protein
MSFFRRSLFSVTVTSKADGCPSNPFRQWEVTLWSPYPPTECQRRLQDCTNRRTLLGGIGFAKRRLLEGRITESKIKVRKQCSFRCELFVNDKYDQRLFHAVVESNGTGTLISGRFRLPLGRQLTVALEIAGSIIFLIAAVAFASATLISAFNGTAISGNQLIDLAVFCLLAASAPLVHFRRIRRARRASEEVLTVISETVAATRVTTNA